MMPRLKIRQALETIVEEPTQETCRLGDWIGEAESIVGAGLLLFFKSSSAPIVLDYMNKDKD